MRKILCSLLCFISCFTQGFAVPQYYCTAADSSHYQNLLNLIGSIHESNFDQLELISVYDLGLTADQKNTLSNIKKVKVCAFAEKNPDLFIYFTLPSGEKVQGWHMWKPIAVKEALESAPYTLWIDPPATVLKPLDALFTYIQQNGYFLMTIGDDKLNGQPQHPLRNEMTAYVSDQFKLNDPSRNSILAKEPVTSGLVGATRRGYALFAKDWYALTKDTRYFADDGSALGGYGSSRYAQTVLSALVYLNGLEVLIHDYKQQEPMMLSTNREQVPFHVTWNGNFVDKHTDILTTKGKFNKSSSIRYK